MAEATKKMAEITKLMVNLNLGPIDPAIENINVSPEDQSSVDFIRGPSFLLVYAEARKKLGRELTVDEMTYYNSLVASAIGRLSSDSKLSDLDVYSVLDEVKHLEGKRK